MTRGGVGRRAWAAGGTVQGWVRVEATELGVVTVEWPRAEAGPEEEPPAAGEARRWAEQALRELREYLAGERREFTVPVDWRQVHGFGRQVLEACARIPYGETVSYGELARRVGSPRAARAVGQALGRNRVPLIVPCHRVIAADGGLGGFGGGLDRKRDLLALERRGQGGGKQE